MTTSQINSTPSNNAFTQDPSTPAIEDGHRPSDDAISPDPKIQSDLPCRGGGDCVEKERVQDGICRVTFALEV